MKSELCLLVLLLLLPWPVCRSCDGVVELSLHTANDSRHATISQSLQTSAADKEFTESRPRSSPSSRGCCGRALSPPWRLAPRLPAPIYEYFVRVPSSYPFAPLARVACWMCLCAILSLALGANEVENYDPLSVLACLPVGAGKFCQLSPTFFPTLPGSPQPGGRNPPTLPDARIYGRGPYTDELSP